MVQNKQFSASILGIRNFVIVPTIGFLSSCTMLQSSDSETHAEFFDKQKTILERTLQPKNQISSQILGYTSTDFIHWKQVQDISFPHSFTSLGLHMEKGHMVLSGQHHVQPPTQAEEDLGLTWSQLLHFDEQNWTAEIRPFTYPNITAHADHQWINNQLWFYAPTPIKSQRPTDPIFFEGTHNIHSTNPNELQISLPFIGDPSPLYTQNSIHLFLTSIEPNQKQNTMAVEYWKKIITPTQDFVLQHRFEGYSNPFAFIKNDKIHLVMQNNQGIAWTSLEQDQWRNIIQVPNLRCENPVIGKGQEKWWLFCVQNAHSF